MVLQNKYKKRASARYNSGRSRRGRGRGVGRGQRVTEETTPAPPIYVEEEEIFEEGWSDDQDGHDEEQASDKASEIEAKGVTQPLVASQRDPQSDPSKLRPRGQFSRRKLVDNSWRYEEAEEDLNLIDQLLPDDDYTHLNKRQAQTFSKVEDSDDEDAPKVIYDTAAVEELRHRIQQAKTTKDMKLRFANNSERRLKQPATIVSNKPKKEAAGPTDDIDDFIDSLEKVKINEESKAMPKTVLAKSKTARTADDDFLDDLLS